MINKILIEDGTQEEKAFRRDRMNNLYGKKDKVRFLAVLLIESQRWWRYYICDRRNGDNGL